MLRYEVSWGVHTSIRSRQILYQLMVIKARVGFVESWLGTSTAASWSNNKGLTLAPALLSFFSCASKWQDEHAIFYIFTSPKRPIIP